MGATSINDSRRNPRHAFTLVELLVVIGIMALLISILLPSLAAARSAAASTASLSNLRQLGIGLMVYKNDYKGNYPPSSSPSSQKPRTRWADAIYPYMRNTAVYMSPLLTDDEKVRMNKPFAHTTDPATGNPIDGVTVYWGGYGYNYQYLGNSRTPGGVKPYHAKDKSIKASQTVAIADTNGSKNGGTTWTAEGVYVVDPPLMSMTLGSNGSRKSSPAPGSGQYGYSGGNDGDPLHRATPAERNRGKVNAVFCDGHAESMKLSQLDDFNGDGQPDNGWWNGKADATQR